MEHIFTDANFDAEVLKSSVLVFVDFWAPWCGPCQMMLPIVDKLAEEYEGKPIKIGKYNVDENSEMAGQYGVMSVPSFIIFKNGEVAEQTVGGVQKEKLEEMINKYL